jgi:arabinose-5-phosphate isomerase
MIAVDQTKGKAGLQKRAAPPTEGTAIPSTRSGAQTLDLARKVLAIEADAIERMARRLDAQFARAVDLLLGCRGRVVVSGIGKSGHIARKLASTLASTGTAAFFVHPAEAGHGDLGMITGDDVMIGLSNSGETAELLAILPAVKRMGSALIALTGNPESTLGKLADAHLHTGVEQEACPLNLAPTASTAAQLAMGDALAMALLDARGFGEADFARSHPGGALGRRLLTRVEDVMRVGDAIPAVLLSATLGQAVLEMTAKRMGMTAVLDDNGHVAGIFTDGDLRRALPGLTDFHAATVADVMTPAPATIAPDALAAEAVRLMESRKVNQILVVVASKDPTLEHTGKLVGALNMHDLFHAKVV